jgi:exonuclease III
VPNIQDGVRKASAKIDMKRGLRILQANLAKIAQAQASLLNDEGLRDFDLLLIQEPHCWRVDGTVVVAPQNHIHWTQYKPSLWDDTHQWPFRSMIWSHRDISARQVEVPSSDITAILIEIGFRKILVASVYVPARGNVEDTALSRRLEHLRGVVQDTRRQYAPQAVEFFLAGDFNRHDQLWGGDAVGANPTQGEGMPIIDFMVDH